MDSPVTVQSLLDYDLWATGRALAPVASLSDDKFRQEFSGDLSSLRQQCVHLVSVSDRYRARIMGDPVPQVEPHAFLSAAEIATYFEDVAERIRRMTVADARAASHGDSA